jgi:Zn-dependent protease
MKQYFKVKRLRVFGAPLYLHWSVFLGIGICVLNGTKQPLYALTCVCSYLAILLVHESGHALVTKYLGYRVYEIRLSIIHGLCVHSGDMWSEWHEVAIAWGGVLAQVIVAIAVLLLSLIPGIDRFVVLGPIFAFLGPISLLIALYNLTPVRPLDGAKAWRIVPLLFEKWRSRRSRKKQKRSPIRAVK